MVDKQTLVFRSMGESDRVEDEDIRLYLSHAHASDDLHLIKTVDELEAMNWDSGKELPKTLAEAKLELASRIASDATPDGEESVGAYDG